MTDKAPLEFMPALRATLSLGFEEDRVEFILYAIWKEREAIGLKPNHPKLGGAFQWSSHSFGWDWWKSTSDQLVDRASSKGNFKELNSVIEANSKKQHAFDPAITNVKQYYL